MSNTTRNTLLVVLAYLAFVSLGLPDGLLGVGWPSIRSDLSVPTEAVGLLLTALVAGYLLSSVAAGFTVGRLGVGRLLAGSTGLAAAALTGYALSSALAMMIVCGFALGLGGGAIDAGLNAYAAGTFGPRQMNWLHACFGAGVAFGPLIMTAALGLGLSWRWGYTTVALAQATLAIAFVLTARAWAGAPARGPDRDPATASGTPEPGATSVRLSQTLGLPAVWTGVLAFGLYAAIEVATGLWAFLLLTEGRGMAETPAGLCVSLYWGSLFVGRVVQGLAAERLGSTVVLRAGLVGMAVGAVLVAVPGSAWLAVAGLVLIGYGAAPVFPLLTLSTKERVGAEHANRAIGLQIAGAGLGGALLPAGMGLLISRSVEVLGPVLVGLSVLLLCVYTLAGRWPADSGPELPGPAEQTDHRAAR